MNNLIKSTAPADSSCTMPEHGRSDAPSSCCHPSSPEPSIPAAQTAIPIATRPTQRFWLEGSTWRRAARNSAHCLLGCAIGDVAAMTIVPLLWPAVPLPLLMAMAIVSGIATSLALETAVLRRREGMAWETALRIAWGMSLISMVTMELAMNVTDWIAMGSQRVPIDHWGYWLAWLPALAIGFLAPLPYNYYKLRRHGRACH